MQEMEKTGTFESMWHLLINGNIRWEYPFSRQANRTSLIRGFVVLFWCTEWIWNKECNTKLLVQTRNNFQSSPRGCLRFVANDGEAREPHRYDLIRRSVPPRAELLVQYPVSRSFPTKWKLQVLSQILVTWTEVRTAVRVLSNLPPPMSENRL